MLRATLAWDEDVGLQDPGDLDDQEDAGPGQASAGPVVLPVVRGPAVGADVICECLQVPLSALESCMFRGCGTVEDLARETGVTTVCGGCTPRVAELVGGAPGYLASVFDVRELLPTVWSFRIAPLDLRDLPVPEALPGQHIVVSALIEGRWVSRPYTLTTAQGEPGFHEITVKREAGGLLSRWLFEHALDEPHPIRVTTPQGFFHADLEGNEPVVFLAGGIGITPAMAMARTAASLKKGARVHVDYSARAAESFAFREELERLAASCERLSVRWRVTAEDGRIGQRDVTEYALRQPDGRFYVCGPEGFQRAVLAQLAAAGVPAERVQVEAFTSARRVEPAQVLAPRRLRDTVSRSLGFGLLALYAVQGLLGWSWPWLEALQVEETYRRWSGAVLLGFIALQWTLPVLRIRGRLRAAAAAYPWHRWLGALAPVFFYAHATWLGYGYLLILGLIFLMNIMVGLADKTLVRDVERRERYGRRWLFAHVVLACLTVGLALFHVVVVFAYK